jgi:hypothetical protein
MTINTAAQDGGLEVGAMQANLDRDGRRKNLDAPLEAESWQQ